MKNFGSTSGLTILAEDQATPANGMVNYITSSYNTGYQNGDIKGAFLSDTDDTDLVGSGELVTNGTFDTDISGWTENGVTSAVSSGIVTVTNSGGSNGTIVQAISTVVGQTYVLQATMNNGTASPRVYSPGGFIGATGSKTFVATAASTNISLLAFGADGTSCTFDNISVKLADEDRSVNNNGLIVNGTVSRDPVNSGADLVAYSGFSSTNYLEMPYNPDLDFGTGDFSIMGWVKTTDSFATILSRADSTSNFNVEIKTGPVLRIEKGGVAADQTGNIPSITSDTWVFVCFVRNSGTTKIYVNGALEYSGSGLSGQSVDSDGAMSIGYNVAESSATYEGSLALWRISATAPTAEQIAKIYNDEKFLFQENAQASLAGTSDAVTALAHDPVTDLLHVGTSAGRSVFQGLRRVDNTTDAVSTAISASNDLIAEQ